MAAPARFSDLPDYAFPRLRKLLDVHAPGGEPIAMSIGEPTHPMPPFVGEVIAANLQGFASYPPNEGTPEPARDRLEQLGRALVGRIGCEALEIRGDHLAHEGTPELLEAISGWLGRRYDVAVGPERILALNGTREGLYNVAMALCPETKNGQRPAVLIPNPFYQVYMVASLSVGAEPVFVPATAETGHLPDYASLPADVLDRVTMAYVCSPANPQGAVADRAYWTRLLQLAETHDFLVLADECYSEVYRDTPPDGALAAAKAMGCGPERVVVFHSLSKRSNLAGLRSGFAAGGPQSIARMRQLRSYAGAPLPLPLQRVAERAWADEGHVAASRALYQDKYRIADEVLGGVPGYMSPQAGFFLWLPAEDGEAAALRLWREAGVRVLPGAYLAKDAGQANPGEDYIRVALVAGTDDVRRGLGLIRDVLYR